MTTAPWAIGLVILTTFISASAPLLLKKGSEHFSLRRLLKQFTNYQLLAGLLLYLIGVGIFTIALQGGELSVLYSISALQYLWAALLGIWLLKEELIKSQWLGVVLIIIGVITVILA